MWSLCTYPKLYQTVGSIGNSGAFIEYVISKSVQGVWNPHVQFYWKLISEVSLIYLFWLFINFKMQQTLRQKVLICIGKKSVNFYLSARLREKFYYNEYFIYKTCFPSVLFNKMLFATKKGKNHVLLIKFQLIYEFIS